MEFLQRLEHQYATRIISQEERQSHPFSIKQNIHLCGRQPTTVRIMDSSSTDFSLRHGLLAPVIIPPPETPAKDLKYLTDYYGIRTNTFTQESKFPPSPDNVELPTTYLLHRENGYLYQLTPLGDQPVDYGGVIFDHPHYQARTVGGKETTHILRLAALAAIKNKSQRTIKEISSRLSSRL
jgi:hypothetical protein